MIPPATIQKAAEAIEAELGVSARLWSRRSAEAALSAIGLAELLEAAEPFVAIGAEMVDPPGQRTDDNVQVWQRRPLRTLTDQLTFGQFRRLSAAIAKTGA